MLGRKGNRNIFTASKLSYCRLAKVECKSHHLGQKSESKAGEEGRGSQESNSCWLSPFCAGDCAGCFIHILFLNPQSKSVSYYLHFTFKETEVHCSLRRGTRMWDWMFCLVSCVHLGLQPSASSRVETTITSPSSFWWGLQLPSWSWPLCSSTPTLQPE